MPELLGELDRAGGPLVPRVFPRTHGMPLAEGSFQGTANVSMKTAIVGSALNPLPQVGGGLSDVISLGMHIDQHA
jgi:hypothetical protein